MKFQTRSRPWILGLLVFFLAVGRSQEMADSGVPVATQWVLDAAGQMQRNAVKSILMMVCPTSQKKGTAFYLADPEIVVTNEHVVHGCTAANLVGHLPTGQKVGFTTMNVDTDRDLAVLRPDKSLVGGLQLGSDTTLKLGNTVSTWGFPLIYNGPAPLLSVGYVAGFNAVTIGGRTVKHIIVNGAFNPGNSGGPVFLSNDNHVIGVVVWKQRILSQSVPIIINGFKNAGNRMSGNFSMTLADGSVRAVSDQEAIGAVLEEFYNSVQIMIGEAISVSELKAFLATIPPARPAGKQ